MCHWVQITRRLKGIVPHTAFPQGGNMSKSITIDATKRGLPAIWETGGGLTSGGSTTIIAKADGSKPRDSPQCSHSRTPVGLTPTHSSVCMRGSTSSTPASAVVFASRRASSELSRRPSRTTARSSKQLPRLRWLTPLAVASGTSRSKKSSRPPSRLPSARRRFTTAVRRCTSTRVSVPPRLRSSASVAKPRWPSKTPSELVSVPRRLPRTRRPRLKQSGESRRQGSGPELGS